MSTTDHSTGTTSTTGTSTTGSPGAATAPARGPEDRRTRTVLVTGVVVSLVLGAAVVAVGLPSDQALFATQLSTLTVAAGLLVATLGISVVGAATARARWRVVDIVVASVLGVAGGLMFALWNLGFYAWLSPVLAPPVSALVAGVWLLPGVVGGLVVRKPGAAVYTELVAAALSALIGNQWGFSTVWYGLLEGLGAEVVLALLLYRRFGLPVALLSGAGAGLVVGLLDTTVFYPDLVPGVQVAYVALAVVSGVVIAGLGGWALTRGLARTGVLSSLASGRDGRRV